MYINFYSEFYVSQLKIKVDYPYKVSILQLHGTFNTNCSTQYRLV